VPLHFVCSSSLSRVSLSSPSALAAIAEIAPITHYRCAPLDPSVESAGFEVKIRPSLSSRAAGIRRERVLDGELRLIPQPTWISLQLVSDLGAFFVRGLRHLGWLRIRWCRFRISIVSIAQQNDRVGGAGGGELGVILVIFVPIVSRSRATNQCPPCAPCRRPQHWGYCIFRGKSHAPTNKMRFPPGLSPVWVLSGPPARFKPIRFLSWCFISVFATCILAPTHWLQ